MKYLDHKKVKQKRPTELSEKFTNYVDRCNVMQNCWVLLTYTKLLLTGVVDLTGKTWSSIITKPTHYSSIIRNNFRKK